MLRVNELKLPINHSEEDIRKRLRSLLKTNNPFEYKIIRRSLDARKKPELFYNYIIDIQIENENAILKKADKKVSFISVKDYQFPYVIQQIDEDRRPVVIGLGPAGLFAALKLAENGFRPIVYERGASILERKKDVDEFWETGILNTESNVQFGEGGAGAFSDGKLNTLVKDKFGRNRDVLNNLVSFGAPSEILYDHKPHIGTDRLIEVVSNISRRIIECGGEIHYHSKLTDIVLTEGRITSIKINDTSVITEGRNIILAIGHSARDTFFMLNEKGLNMTPKPFAVGLRVEHPAEKINLSQYGREQVSELGNAAYKVTHQCKDNRGVYSFCMCPGGYVVNASSEEGLLAVNGMSYYARDAKNSNSAIIITVNPEDYGDGIDPMSGIEFQRKLERKAYEIGKGKIPVEMYGEYKKGKLSDIIPKPCMRGMYEHAPVHEILPDNLSSDFIEGMEGFGRMIKGFNDDDTLVSGIESRTSSPVRMERSDVCLSNILNLYPCGEGAGYAGGISSAAMDGILVAECAASSIIGKSNE